MKIKSVTFVKSSGKWQECPEPSIPEYAFIGRSNVGKSSLINALMNHKDLAKTSQTPGKTQLINHFLVNEEWYLTDLPGYGYAKVSKNQRKDFEKLITNYILNRKNLVHLFVLVDIRHTPQKIDLEFMEWCGENGISFSIIFTKSDKLKQYKSLSKNSFGNLGRTTQPIHHLCRKENWWISNSKIHKRNQRLFDSKQNKFQ